MPDNRPAFDPQPNAGLQPPPVILGYSYSAPKPQRTAENNILQLVSIVFQLRRRGDAPKIIDIVIVYLFPSELAGKKESILWAKIKLHGQDFPDPADTTLRRLLIELA